MNFRTEIEPIQGAFLISHQDKIVLLGSCFSDEIGEQLEMDGFSVVRNPLGPLYNPASIANVFVRGEFSEEDFVKHDDGFHCLDFASRYTSADATTLAAMVNRDFVALKQALEDADVIIITFGTAYVYDFVETSKTVGNCHRLPASMFNRRQMSVDEIVGLWKTLIPQGKKVIFTLSPIRHVADGLVNNSLSKSTLRIAIDEICKVGRYDYFPAFEILNDDLRDYRFYASDLKHPSEMAVAYVYEHFSKAYFSPSVVEQARIARKAIKQQQHIPNYRRK